MPDTLKKLALGRFEYQNDRSENGLEINFIVSKIKAISAFFLSFFRCYNCALGLFGGP